MLCLKLINPCSFSDAEELSDAKGSKLITQLFFRAFLQARIFLLFFTKGDFTMEEKVSIIGIIVENNDSTDKLNELLHEYGSYIIGRMGIPYQKKDINVISIVLDAPVDIINTLSGKIGMLDGISSKVVCSKG